MCWVGVRVGRRWMEILNGLFSEIILFYILLLSLGLISVWGMLLRPGVEVLTSE